MIAISGSFSTYSQFIFNPRLLPSHMHILYNLVNQIRKPNVLKDVQVTGTNVGIHLFGLSLTRGLTCV